MAIAGTIIGAALALGSSLYSGYKSSQANKAVRDNVAKQQAENEAWYNRRYNEDPLQRTSAQRVLTRTQEMLRQRNKAAQGRAAVTGATEESVAAEKAAGSEAMADAMSRIAAQGEARKDAIEQQYMAQKQGLYGQENALNQQQAQQIAAAGAGAANAIGNAGVAVDEYFDDYERVPKPQRRVPKQTPNYYPNV